MKGGGSATISIDSSGTLQDCLNGLISKRQHSIHRSGFVQFSGPGIVSGIDKVTQQPKGLAIKIDPLTKPITSGPTFGISIWGLEDFQALKSEEIRKNYIVFGRSDFYPDPPNVKRRDTLIFAGFLFPTSLAGEVDLRGNQPTLTRPFSNYLWERGKMFRLIVVFLKKSPMFIGILPQFTEWVGGDRGNSGYQLDGPSELVGRNSRGVLEGIHLKASYPRPGFLKNEKDIES